MNILLLAKARRDLKTITAYSFEQWGLERAERYTRILETSFEKLINTPYLGISCDDVHSGYRKHFVEFHVIFYRISETTITIIRILDQRMDAKKQLNS